MTAETALSMTASTGAAALAGSGSGIAAGAHAEQATPAATAPAGTATVSAPPAAAFAASSAGASAPAADVRRGSDAQAPDQAFVAPASSPADVPAGATQAAAAPVSQAPATPGPATVPQPAPQTSAGTAAALRPQLAAPLFTLVDAPHGEHVMTLTVSPEDLGPVTVRAHIDATGVRIELFSAGDAGREAVRSILPELRKELTDAGFGASLQLSDRDGPGSSRQDANDAGAARQNGTGKDPGRDGSDPGGRPGSGGARAGHRWDDLADATALRAAGILNGPQTTLDILA